MRKLLIFILLLNFNVYSQEKFDVKIKELNSSMNKNNTLLSKKRFSFLKKEINNLSIELFDMITDSLNNTKSIVLHVEFVQSYGYSLGIPSYFFYVYDVNSNKEWVFKYEKDGKKNNFNHIEKSKLTEYDLKYFEFISHTEMNELIKLSNSYKSNIIYPQEIEFEFAEFIYYLNYEKNIFSCNNFMLHFPLSVEKGFE
ncbi:hypothetical protein SAMN05421741_1497 [Paenimyroides ummariense]|uniref:Uncharacterized protein n=1 Tax=Paenimyroides ummariense TaxID=913024 RepID=A0A1I5GSL8_9FLAO|nr:hypothetical protein [Paenimyroides ummariense]SFO38998.1 hypothetical protein SAMN05421741_1497 [Paenimyroides ummariense]